MINILSILNSDLLNGIANASQIYDVTLNLKQVSNDELMKELETQDNLYLKKCIEQNEEIIEQNKNIIGKLDKILNFLNSRV